MAQQSLLPLLSLISVIITDAVASPAENLVLAVLSAASSSNIQSHKCKRCLSTHSPRTTINSPADIAFAKTARCDYGRNAEAATTEKSYLPRLKSRTHHNCKVEATNSTQPDNSIIVHQ